MKNPLKIAALEAQIGPRGSTVIAGAAARTLALSWLGAQNAPWGATGKLQIAEINGIYNDVSDIKLHGLLAAPPAPAPAPAPAATNIGDDGGIAAAFANLQSLLLAQKPAAAAVGVDEAAVRGIVEPLLGEVESSLQVLRDEIAPLAALAAKAAADASASARIPVLAAAASGNRIVDRLLPHYRPGVDVLTKVCVTAPPSFGKSYSIRILGRSYDLFLEHGCSPDADEIPTLLGSPVPDGKGGFTIVDGVLTQAVRAAASGKTVLLFLDELFRLNSVAENWFLAFLTGVKSPAGRVYQLRTRRVTASGDLEVITCPAGNLHIIGASNLGLSRPSDAFWSRFLKHRLEWNLADCTAVAKSLLDSYGIFAPTLPAKYAALIGVSRTECKAGRINYPVDFRLLESACEVAATPDEACVSAFVKAALVDQVANWDGDLGDTDANAAALVAGWHKLLD